MSPMPEEENLQIGHCDNDVAMRPYLLFVIFCTAAQFRTWNCTQKKVAEFTTKKVIRQIQGGRSCTIPTMTN